jgi:malate/lactate dehydrogenase
MSTVAVFGAGDVGAACAQALASRERARRILLIDSAADVAAGKALDIQQAGAITGCRTRLEATADETRAIGSAVIVLADRCGSRASEWDGEEGLALVRRVGGSTDAPLVFAGSAQTGLMLATSQEGRIAGRRLIGSASEAFASAVCAIVAMEARCSPREVFVAVLGTPPAFVIPWSDASIGGYALERVVSTVQLRRIEARAARLWPPGPYALGAAAARAVEAALDASRRSYSVLTVLDGEFGVRNRVAAVPALLGSYGVVRIRTPLLSTRERVQLDTALASDA